MNRAVFFDRDGTIAKDVNYCRRPEDFVLFPEAAKVIKKLNKCGFKVIIITNQSGIARGYFDEEVLNRIHKKMQEELARKCAYIDGVYYCPHHPDDNCECRKPKPALVLQAARDLNIDLEQSFVVGDLQKDMELGKVAGCKTILIGGPSPTESDGVTPDAIVASLAAVSDAILGWGDNDGNTEVNIER